MIPPPINEPSSVRMMLCCFYNSVRSIIDVNDTASLGVCLYMQSSQSLNVEDEHSNIFQF